MSTIAQLKADYIKAHCKYERASNARYLAELALENSSISAKALRQFRNSVWSNALDKAADNAVKRKQKHARKVH